MFYTYYDSPIGRLTIVSTLREITHLFLTTEHFKDFQTVNKLVDDPQHLILREAVKQLDEYFYEGRANFDLPFEIKGTDFQKKIWAELRQIPIGQVCSYQDIAIKIGNKSAVRAIGQANKANRLPIFIPCHRVIGKNQRLTGYAGDKNDLKAKLLTHENVSFKH
ncbi:MULTISPECIES: methylated-DNA--[protein]-cysteine S-methyltransferase [Bacillaceae]|uniref:methylated-DNA--[protein]-cysteine S-methyltransferase n=1 Tax=Bacillaceae TaxID=186817 RepID=UPI000BFC51C4|nr:MULTISPECIES: methylated-DNA--[protein]-cysteine S-methyltransferase [Bacillaceae]PGT82376.1 cysteine methyltransferase [Bacillus sp. AFS040349]UGB32330.1 methylated-DNA--[protein]-cysteine S-methyltransferase [Metabacillus sp. B2-18]